MLKALREQVARWRAGASTGSGSGPEAARHRREDRKHQLQEEIRRIQQEIADLDTSERAGTDRPSSDTDSDAMAILHRELEEKQRELARYQARI